MARAFITLAKRKLGITVPLIGKALVAARCHSMTLEISTEAKELKILARK